MTSETRLAGPTSDLRWSSFCLSLTNGGAAVCQAEAARERDGPLVSLPRLLPQMSNVPEDRWMAARAGPEEHGAPQPLAR